MEVFFDTLSIELSKLVCPQMEQKRLEASPKSRFFAASPENRPNPGVIVASSGPFERCAGIVEPRFFEAENRLTFRLRL